MSDFDRTLDVEPRKLGSIAGRGIAINYAAQLTRFILQVGYGIAIARLLVPEQFGIVAMASPVIAFVTLLADLGLSQAAIQRREISNADFNLLFWANLSLTVCMSVAILLSSSLVARFYGEPLVAPVLAVFAGTMVIGALGSQHFVLLNRELRFGAIAGLDMIGFAAGAAVSLVAAVYGFGIWAIVINQVALVSVRTIMLWSTVKWRPSFRWSSDRARELIGFGADVAISNFANFFARNLDNILIGKVWGNASLGVYDRAYRLLLLPLSQITIPVAKIAVPLLSRVQHDENAYRRAYFLMLEMVLGLTYPGAIMALVTHDQLIRVVLGAKWMAAAPIFGILAVGPLFAPISNSMSWLLMSQGRTRRMRNYTIVSSVAFAAGIVAGLPWGPLGVATGYIAVGVVQGPILWILTIREGPVGPKSLWQSLWPLLVGGGAAFVVAVMLQRFLPESFLSLLTNLAASYAAFLLALLALRRSRESLFFLIGHIREIVENRVRI